MSLPTQTASRRRESSTPASAPSISNTTPSIGLPSSTGRLYTPLIRPTTLRFSFQRSASSFGKDSSWDGAAAANSSSTFKTTRSPSILDLEELSPVELEAGERSPVLERKRRLFDHTSSETDPLQLTAAYVKHFLAAPASVLSSSSSSSAKRRLPVPRVHQITLVAAFWIALAFLLTALSGNSLFASSPASIHSLSSEFRAMPDIYLHHLGPAFISASPSKDAATTAAPGVTRNRGQTAAAEARWASVAREGGHTAPHVVHTAADASPLSLAKWEVLMDDLLM